VEVREFELTGFENSEVNFRISCSKGTYIRSLARDLGELLGVGAYLKSLCRTRIGNYSLTDAHEVSQLVEEIKSRQNENLPGLN
jgi:tRNA pseudouridine55 synthase